MTARCISVLAVHHKNLADIKRLCIFGHRRYTNYKSVITRHSLVRAKGEVFVLLYVCLFVRSTISQQPAGRFTPNFACGRSLGRDVSSPLLGVGGPRVGTCLLPFWGLAAPGWRKKRQMKFSLLWSQLGIFCILAVFERYLSNACTDPHQILFVYGQCLPTYHLPLWDPSAPGGAGGGGVKYSKNWGWSHSCCGQLPFLFFSAMPNVVLYVGHRPAHILV